jgi:hypothetical protein
MRGRRCVIAVVLGCACGPRIGDGAANGGGTDSGNESTGNTDPGEVVIHEEPLRQLDLLFVVDDSASTATLGPKVASLARTAIENFEAPDVRVDVRFAVTTTDNGNIMCDQVTSPERGAFVATSCRQRLSDFVTPIADETTSCTESCSLDTLALPQPWIELERGQSNVPAGIATGDAAACLVPQGVAGCGFESPLASMKRALELARDPISPQYGFLRDEAVLAIVIVTDEEDCSAAPQHQATAFGPDGNHVFWPFPEAPFPTSAVCWNAGVQCLGDPDHFDSCDPIDRGVDGLPASGADAVMVPVSEHIAFLQAIEDEKKAIDPDAEVLVSVVAGVPLDYASTGVIDYAYGPDPDDPDSFQGTFGIGPGCTTDTFSAVPPVRLREFASAFDRGGDNNLISVCHNDYTEALAPLFGFRDQIRPACVPICVADVDDSPGLQPDCTVHERWSEDGAPQDVAIRMCDPGDALPAGANVCFVPLTDKAGATETTNDDMQAECIDAGWNLELRIVRREGFPIAGGATISVACEPDPDAAC